MMGFEFSEKEKHADRLKVGMFCFLSILYLFPVFWGRTTAAQDNSVPLHWLQGTEPGSPTGVSWGIPWPRGQVQPDDPFTLVDAAGKNIPVQKWTMAYWPDGYVKWTGLAAVTDSRVSDSLYISVGQSIEPAIPVTAYQDNSGITIDTGPLECKISSNGTNFISSLKLKGKEVATNGRLIALREDRSRYQEEGIIKEEKFESRVDSISLEQSGPVRAVVKVEGMHAAVKGDRAWLPFVIRLYFYAGEKSVRIVHSFVFDGDQNKDFIKGLGIRFSVPMHAQMHNRWAKFSGDSGLFSEPSRLIAGRMPEDKNLYARQESGKAVPDKDELPGGELIDEIAVWNDYKLVQLNDGSYSIHKRTNEKSAWIKAGRGARSSGLAYVGDPSGGLAVGMRNFWQLSPTELEINNVLKDTSDLTVWLYSPDAQAMDLRHYDTEGHGLDASYEDYQKGFSEPYGIARTSELTLHAFNELPENELLVQKAEQSANPPVMVSTPEYYYSTNTFGHWGLPDRSTPIKRKLEGQLDLMFSFYKEQVKEQHWYGFWDYGDIMHTYDPYRHSWKYDVGGFAWMNSEECPDLWLWYSFLRTGRTDIFRMAEAMTRHTQEVDVYHRGRFAGLGSRHNVRHWGDSAKELRISQALLKRFYYYLTTDERTGDLMKEVADADKALLEVDPLRKILPESPYPTHIRSGPDWLAAASNWMTEWERTGNIEYRDKITTGMKALADMPEGLLTSLSFGYDPHTNMLYDIPDQHLPVGQFVMIMGGAETAFELETLLEVPEWSDAWLDLCKQWARTGGGDMAAPRAIAYAAYRENDPRLGRVAWKRLFEEGDGTGLTRFPDEFTSVTGPDIPSQTAEIPRYVSTGHLSQWALNIIETLELAGKWLPDLKDVK